METKTKGTQTYKVRTVRYEEFYLFAKDDQEARKLSREMCREQRVKRVSLHKTINGETTEVSMIENIQTDTAGVKITK